MSSNHALIRQAKDLAICGAHARIGEAAQLADELVECPGEGWKHARSIDFDAAALGHLGLHDGADGTCDASRLTSTTVATGQIHVDAGVCVELHITRWDENATQVLTTLKSGDIQAITVDLSAGTPTAGFLKSIAHLTDLRRLTVNYAHIDTRHLRRLRFMQHLDLMGCSGFDEDSLSALSAMKNLKSLRLSSIDAPPLAFERLPRFAHLTSLRATDTTFGDEALSRVAPCASHLEELGLAKTSIDADAVRSFPPTPRLRVLELNNIDVADDDLRNLLAGQDLRTARLSNSNVGDATLRRLSRHPKLHRLELSECSNVTDAGVRHLRRNLELDLLWMGWTGATGACLEAISALPKLSNLGIGGLGLTDADLRWLHRLTSLRGLWAYGNRHLCDTALARLVEQLPNLWGLGLSGCRIGERFTVALTGLARLTDLTLQHTPMTTKMVINIARCTGIEELDLKGCDITDAQAAHLGRLRRVRVLDLEDNPRIGDRTANAIGRLTRLRRLDLHGTSVSDDGMRTTLPRLPNLDTICLEDTRIGDGTLAALAANTDLCELNIGGTAVTDDGLKHLVGCINLQQLSIRDTPITDAGIASLAQIGSRPNADELAKQFVAQRDHDKNPTQAPSIGNALARLEKGNVPAAQRADDVLERLGVDTPRPSRSKLRTLDMRDLDLTDQALKSLATCRHLTSANLRGCAGLSRDGIATLRMRLTAAWIHWREPS